MANMIPLPIGETVGAFTVLGMERRKESINGYKKPMWKVRCNLCGKVKYLSRASVLRDQSCGCEIYGKSRNPDGIDSNITRNMNQYRHRTKKSGYKFDLTYEQFKSLISAPCSYCGAELGDKGTNKTKGNKGGTFLWHGIDRIDTKKGYVLGNCRTSCVWCNRAKNKDTLDLFVMKCIAITKNMEKRGKWDESAYMSS